MSPDYPANDGPSLNAVLDSLGYTTRPARFHCQKDILANTGDVLVTGDAKMVWAWLRSTGQHQ